MRCEKCGAYNPDDSDLKECLSCRARLQPNAPILNVSSGSNLEQKNMKRFDCEVTDTQGQKRRWWCEAPNENLAKEWLRSKGLIVQHLKESIVKKPIRGWLLFYIIAVGGGGAVSLLNYVQGHENFARPPFTLSPLEIFLFLDYCARIVFGVFQIYTGILLLDRNSKAVKYTKKFLGVGSIYLIFSLILYLVFCTKFASYAGRSSDDFIVSRLVQAVYLMIWFSYFSNSKRVKDTYEK